MGRLGPGDPGIAGDIGEEVLESVPMRPPEVPDVLPIVEPVVEPLDRGGNIMAEGAGPAGVLGVPVVVVEVVGPEGAPNAGLASIGVRAGPLAEVDPSSRGLDVVGVMLDGEPRPGGCVLLGPMGAPGDGMPLIPLVPFMRFVPPRPPLPVSLVFRGKPGLIGGGGGTAPAPALWLGPGLLSGPAGFAMFTPF